MELRTKIVSAVIRSLKLPPRFRLKMVKEDPVRLELSLTPSYGKNPVIVGLVESLDLVARRDREGRLPRDLQGTWDWTCLLYTSPSPRDLSTSRMPSSA